ncbi:restriction endonuclease [soil metagenome]
MSMPDYQSLMLPLLELLGDGRARHLNEYTSELADKFGLTDEERSALLPSGNQERFKNRASWARTYLSKAGLVAKVGRGTVEITDLGKEVLASPPPSINISYLLQFQSFQEFRLRPAVSDSEGAQPSEHVDEPVLVPVEDPIDRLETAYLELRSSLAEELLETVKVSSPEFFESLVVDLLVAMGYGGSRKDAGQAVGKSGDGGIDGIIKEDRLGLDFVYIQAKRWEGPVSRPMVQGFAGSLDGYRARKGVFITTSRFTSDAHAYVNNIEKRIVLIDGEQLTNYMIDFGIGVTDVSTIHVRRIDQDYFDA